MKTLIANRRRNVKTETIGKYIAFVCSVIVIYLLLTDGLSKLHYKNDSILLLAALKILPYTKSIGCIQIILGILFAHRNTMKISFLLLSCYLSVTLALSAFYDAPVYKAASMLTLLWIATFCRDASTILPVRHYIDARKPVRNKIRKTVSEKMKKRL